MRQRNASVAMLLRRLFSRWVKAGTQVEDELVETDATDLLEDDEMM